MMKQKHTINLGLIFFLVLTVFSFAGFGQDHFESRGNRSKSEKSGDREGKRNPSQQAPGESRGSDFGTADSKNSESKTSEIQSIIDKLDYPELQVVPRATQRLKMEATDEESKWYIMHWPMEMSGIAALYMGMTAKSQARADLSETMQKDLNNVATAAQAFGAGWLLTGLVLGGQKPYSSGLATVLRFNDKGERGMLLRERLAEEALEKPARVMRVLSTASMVTNFVLTAYTGSFLTDQGKVTAILCSALTLIPLAFQDHSINVYEKHLEYKKKIYGPVTTTSLGFDDRSQTVYPMTMLTWNF